MSEITGRTAVSAPSEAPWQKPAAADDIVDPIDGIVDSETMGADERDIEREQSIEEEEDVPLDVKLTDALAMLADGGHDYGSRPILKEEADETASGGDYVGDLGDIDESSKDA